MSERQEWQDLTGFMNFYNLSFISECCGSLKGVNSYK